MGTHVSANSDVHDIVFQTVEELREYFILQMGSTSEQVALKAGRQPLNCLQLEQAADDNFDVNTSPPSLVPEIYVPPSQVSDTAVR